MFAPAPARGTFYFDKQGRERKAAVNKRGKIVGRVVKKKNPVTASFESLYRDKSGRWRATRIDSSGVRRGGMYAPAPAPGTFYFDKQGRKRKAAVNKRGKIVGRVVKKKTRGLKRDAVDFSKRLRSLWARRAGKSQRDVHVHVWSEMQANGNGKTTVKLDAPRAPLGYHAFADLMADMEDDERLTRELQRRYPGVVLALKVRDPETGWNDWAGHVATSELEGLYGTAAARAKKDAQKYGGSLGAGIDDEMLDDAIADANAELEQQNAEAMQRVGPEVTGAIFMFWLQ